MCLHLTGHLKLFLDTVPGRITVFLVNYFQNLCFCLDIFAFFGNRHGNVEKCISGRHATNVPTGFKLGTSADVLDVQNMCMHKSVDTQCRFPLSAVANPLNHILCRVVGELQLVPERPGLEIYALIAGLTSFI